MKIRKRINNSDRKKIKRGRARIMVSGLMSSAVPRTFKSKKNKIVTVTNV